MKKRTIVTVFVAVAGVALAGGCGDEGPTGPASTRSNIARMELVGPAVIAPGETASYTLSASRAIGPAGDATAEAIWTSNMPASVRFDKPGSATGLAVGEGAISALFAGRTSVKTVIVTPKGTFRLKGIIQEADSPGRVSGAIVTVRSGSDVVETTTGPDGSFTLFGVPAEGELQVRHGAYVQHTETLHLTDHATLNVRLSLADPSGSWGGRYTLTVGSSACSGGGSVPALAASLRQRSYTADIEQKGQDLTVTLSGAEFSNKPSGISNRFFGRSSGTRATFFIWGPGNYYYYYYSRTGADISEQLQDGTFLVPSGFATVTDAGTALQGTLSGSIVQRGEAVGGSPLARCSGSAIPFVFSR